MVERGLANQGNYPPGRLSDLARAMQLATVTEEGQDQIRPDVVTFLMQAAQASHAARLRQLEESRISVGAASLGMTVTAQAKLILQDPFISFTLINDGPNSVYLEINTSMSPDRSAPILVNESFAFDAIYPTIKHLILDVVAGQSAAVRIRGRTGHPMGHEPNTG